MSHNALFSMAYVWTVVRNLSYLMYQLLRLVLSQKPLIKNEYL